MDPRSGQSAVRDSSEHRGSAREWDVVIGRFPPWRRVRRRLVREWPVRPPVLCRCPAARGDLPDRAGATGGVRSHRRDPGRRDIPRELVDNDARLIPGDGIAPVTGIIQKLVEKGYNGALSVELFRAEFQQGDPFEVALEIREKCEAVMSEAGVAPA